MRNRKSFLYSFLIIILFVGVSYLLCLILDESEVFLALLSKVGYSGAARAIFLSFQQLTGCSGRLALVLFFAVKAVNGTLFQEIFSCMEEAGPSSGASSSNPGNPVVPPIDQGVQSEVNQDAIWEEVDAEERRKEEELRNSKEWKESEQHLLKIEDMKKSIGQRAKEIAQERGLSSERCEAVEDAAKYIAEDVEDIAERQQLRFLRSLMRDLNNPNSESWERIEKEVKRWRPWED